MDFNVSIIVDAGPRIAPLVDALAGQMGAQSEKLNGVLDMLHGILKGHSEAQITMLPTPGRPSEDARESDAPKEEAEAPKPRRSRRAASKAEEPAAVPEKAPSIGVVVMPDPANDAEVEATTYAAAMEEGVTGGEAPAEPLSTEEVASLRERVQDLATRAVKTGRGTSVRAMLDRFGAARVSLISEENLAEAVAELSNIVEGE
ncbi:hypothetical protein [uncultured Alistipes sp.]|uniref:hypothetical protein n=1 Tax=uncultured Alistipes sp. TaxID=538949 RepID=UPI0026480D79|nr:hypothetical protein [uncultured Alistipes sp.]